MKLPILIKVPGVFLLVIVVFVLLGYYCYNSMSEPANIIVFLLIANIGLVIGIILAKRMIPKKTLPYKQPGETDNPD